MTDLSRLLVDTVFVQGLYNASDQFHDVCIQALPFVRAARQIFVTDAILMEIGNAFSTIQRRTQGGQIIRDFLKSTRITVVHLSPQYFEKTLQLYEQRNDKECGWSTVFHLSSCKSFNSTLA